MLELELRPPPQNPSDGGGARFLFIFEIDVLAVECGRLMLRLPIDQIGLFNKQTIKLFLSLVYSMAITSQFNYYNRKPENTQNSMAIGTCKECCQLNEV